VAVYRPRVLRLREPLIQSVQLFTSDEDVPPKYKTGSGISFRILITVADQNIVRSLCTVDIDLRKLPQGAIKRCENGTRQYFEAQYDLGLTFAGELQLKLMYEGTVIGGGTSSYF
jgi:hypothetical protein